MEIAEEKTGSRVLQYLPYASLLTFFVSWQLSVDLGIIPRELLATPTDVLRIFIVKLYQVDPDGALLIKHIGVSMEEVLLGYLLAMITGIPLGLLMGWFLVAEGLARPIFEIIRPVPQVAWIPLAIFWFGIGLTGKVYIIWISGVVPFVINSYVGVRLTNPALVQMARTYGASSWQIFLKICIPSARPMVFGGLQIGLAYCWIALVAAELIAADAGLGFVITMGRRLLRPDLIVLGMLMVGLTGALFGILIDRVEKRYMGRIRR